MDQRFGVKRGVEPGADLPLSGRVNSSTTCMTIEQSQDGGCATSQRGQDLWAPAQWIQSPLRRARGD